MLPWIILTFAGLFEVVWAVGLKHTGGFTKLRPSMIVIVAMLMSFFLLARAAKTIHPPLAYSVWVGIGVVGAWAVTVLWFKDPFRPAQVMFVALVLVGVIGLKLTSGPATPVP